VRRRDSAKLTQPAQQAKFALDADTLLFENPGSKLLNQGVLSVVGNCQRISTRRRELMKKSVCRIALALFVGLLGMVAVSEAQDVCVQMNPEPFYRFRVPSSRLGYLLDRLLAAQAQAFENEGGFTERLYRIRNQRRRS
jgi:four helix bundle suffix protein